MTTSEQDKALVERVKQGDTWAFENLVNKYKDDAYSLACSIVKDPVLAEDVLQEVLITVFDKISGFRYQSAFYTWLYRMVVNRCFNEIRKKKHLTDDWIEGVSEDDEAAALTNMNDLKNMVNTALKLMKPDEALVLRLFYLNELSIEESMKVSGFSKSKTKVTLHRGRKSFAEIMKSKFGKEIDDI